MRLNEADYDGDEELFLSEAWEDGYSARHAVRPLSENPYSINERAHTAWAAGWVEADEDIETCDFDNMHFFIQEGKL